MTKKDLIKQVHAKLGDGLSEKTVADVTETTLKALVEIVKETEKFQVPGFGTFTLKKRAARKGRNPRTGEELTIAASTSIGFKAAAALKRTLN